MERYDNWIEQIKLLVNKYSLLGTLLKIFRQF